MNTKMQLLRGTGWVTAAAILSRGTMFAASIIVAHILGKAKFGSYVLVWSTVSAVAIFAGLALNATGCKFIAQFKAADRERAGGFIATLLFLAACGVVFFGLLYFFSAPLLAERVFTQPEIAPLLAISVWAVAAKTFDDIFSALLIGLRAFRILAAIRTLYCVGTLVLTYVLTTRWALSGAIWSLNLAFSWGAFLLAVALTIVLRQSHICINWSRCWQKIGAVVRFAVPVYLVNMLTFPLMYVGITMLVRQPAGLLEVATFGVADRLRTLAMFIPGNVAVVALALLPKSYEEKDASHFIRNVESHFRMIAIIVLPTLVALIGLGRVLIQVLYGALYSSAWQVAVVLLLSGFFSTIIAMMVQVFRSAGRVWTIVAMFAISGICYLAGVWLFLPGLGALSLAWLWLISQALGLAVWAIVLRQAFPVRIYRFSLWLVVVPVFLLAAATLNLAGFFWAVLGVLILLVALSVVLFCLLLTPDERQYLRASLRRFESRGERGR